MNSAPAGVGPGKIAHETIPTNGVRLHVALAGPERGSQVIMLHGFPEFWYGWRHQIPPLAEAGNWVWAPDQRGYNLSDKPRGLAAYKIDQLAADILGLVDAAGRDRACLVAHDWGTAVAWWLAANFPARVARMVIINGPHPHVFREHLRRNLAQIRRSWYFLFFQIPWLPEALARWMMRRPPRAGSEAARMLTGADPQLYLRAWQQPGALTAMINWYRAAARSRSRPAAPIRIQVPTLLIWGTQDRYLGRELAEPSVDLCEHGRLVHLEGGSHWLHQERPQEVNGLILDFLSN